VPDGTMFDEGLVPMRILSRVFLLSLMFIVLETSSAAAGTVNIEPSAGRSVTVVAESATISEVISRLGETYDFRLDQKGGPRALDATRVEQLAVDGRFEGPLRAVLERLLAKESYFIEHAAQSKSGISRVVLYNVAPPQPTAQSATRVIPLIARRSAEPVDTTAAVERYPQVAAPAAPAIVPPVRRVQPAPPQVAVRPNAVTPAASARPQAVLGQTAATGGATQGAVATNASGTGPTQPAPLRKRGGILQ
jgi:hypothetical protein